MSILLKIDSTLAESVQSGAEFADDFTISYENPIQLDRTSQTENPPWELSLIKANLWYSWYNISAAKGNNVMSYNNGVDPDELVTIDDGQYTIEQLYDVLTDEMLANGDFVVGPSGNEFDIIIEPNFATLKVAITLTNGYDLDLSSGDLYLLLGWTQAVHSHTGKLDGTSPANINDSINTLVIKCSIIAGDGSYDNEDRSRALFQFVPSSSPGTNIEVLPLTKIYLPIEVTSNEIRAIRMQIVDNLNRRIDFNDTPPGTNPVTYMMHLRQTPFNRI